MIYPQPNSLIGCKFSSPPNFKNSTLKFFQFRIRQLNQRLDRRGVELKFAACRRKQFRSINFIVSADAFEQNRLFALVFHELKNHTHVVTRAARPRTGKFALELVRLELRMKSILRQQVQNRLQFRCRLRMSPRKPAARPDERRGWQQQPFQARRRLMICAGVAGRQPPSLNSRRADFTASASSARRCSASRRWRTSTSDSCSSMASPSAESRTCENFVMAKT